MAKPTGITFVAQYSGRVQVIVGFEASVAGSGSSDFGASTGYRIVLQEFSPAGVFIRDAVGPLKPVALARGKYMDLLTTTITAGNTIKAGMSAQTGGNYDFTWYNVETRVELLWK